MYANVNVNISNSQKEKLTKALAAENQLTIRFSHEDLINGSDVITVTQTQLNRLRKAYENGTGVTIKMSKTQLAHNMKIEGGFLPLLAGLASQSIPFITGPVLPALGVGALSGLASSGVQKLVGNGLFLKKGSRVCEIETDGKQVLLGPVNEKEFEGGFTNLGDGLYLKKEGQIYDGKGLLLGPNSLLKIFQYWVCCCRINDKTALTMAMKNGRSFVEN